MEPSQPPSSGLDVQQPAAAEAPAALRQAEYAVSDITADGYIGSVPLRGSQTVAAVAASESEVEPPLKVCCNTASFIWAVVHQPPYHHRPCFVKHQLLVRPSLTPTNANRSFSVAAQAIVFSQHSVWMHSWLIAATLAVAGVRFAVLKKKQAPAEKAAALAAFTDDPSIGALCMTDLALPLSDPLAEPCCRKLASVGREDVLHKRSHGRRCAGWICICLCREAAPESLFLYGVASWAFSTSCRAHRGWTTFPLQGFCPDQTVFCGGAGVLLMDDTGSVGLDLSFASAVFLMEPLADPALEEQARGFVHAVDIPLPGRWCGAVCMGAALATCAAVFSCATPAKRLHISNPFRRERHSVP